MAGAHFTGPLRRLLGGACALATFGLIAGSPAHAQSQEVAETGSPAAPAAAEVTAREVATTETPATAPPAAVPTATDPTSTEPPVTDTAAQSDAPSTMPLEVWIAGGITAASLVAATVVGFLALETQKDFDAAPNHADADRGERLAIYADLLFGVALAAGISALVIYAVAAGEAADDPSPASGTGSVAIAPAVGPDGAGLAASLTF